MPPNSGRSKDNGMANVMAVLIEMPAETTFQDISIYRWQTVNWAVSPLCSIPWLCLLVSSFTGIPALSLATKPSSHLFIEQ